MCAEPVFEPAHLSGDLLFRHHPQPLWVVDVPSLRLLDVNAAALESYRLARGAFLSRTLPEMWLGTPPRLTAATSDPEVLAGAVSGPAIHRRGDGTSMAVLLEARALPGNGRKLLLVGASRDGHAHDADQGGSRLLGVLLEMSSEGVLVLDPERRITGVNPRAAVLLGTDAESLVGIEAERLFPADDILTPTLLRAADEQALRAEVTLQRLDGGTVPAELSLRPLPGGGAVALVSDVTMKRTAERSLARSERRFRALIQHSNDVIVVLDASGRLIYQSPAARRLGFDETAERGIDLSKGVHPRDRASVEDALARLVEEGGAQTITFRFATGRGWRWLEVVASNRLADADVEGLVLNVRDVSERVEAERKLRESEATYRALFEKGMEGVMLIEQDRSVRVASGPALRLLGYAPGELLGRERSDLIHEDDRDAFLDALDLVEAKAGSSEPVRFRLRDAGEVWRWLEGTVTNLEDDADVGAIVLNFREITDRVRAMEKISDLNAELRRRVAHLQSLRRIDMAITNSVDLRLVLDIFVDQVLTDLEVDAVAVLLFDGVASDLSPFVGRGFDGDLDPSRRTRLGTGPAGRAALEQRTVYIPDLRAQEERGAAVTADRQDGFVTYLSVPLLAKGQLQGVVELYTLARLDPGDEWLEFLETYADQGAIAIENSQLLRSLEQSNVELQRAYDRTIEGWAFALDLKDEETAGHSKRVTDMAVRLARNLGMEPEELVHLQRGALLHDIGKMGIPDSILLKGEELTEDEYELMKRHPVYAYELLSPIEFLRPALDIPYCHHERWDGSGYPRGLAGEQIPLAARVFAVIDVFDALTSDRPYRPAWPRERALGYLRAESGRQFDPSVVDAFLSIAGGA